MRETPTAALPDRWAERGAAKAVMRDRQAGRPMPEIMALYAHQDGESAYRAIVRAAYAQPRYSTPSYQSREIFDFSSEVYRVCLEARLP